MSRWGIVAMLGLLLGACSPGAPAFVDLAALERPSSPNTYLVCLRTLTVAEVDREPDVWPVPVADLERLWLEALASEPRTRLVASEPERHRHLFVQRTAVFRFPDVIQLDVLPVAPAGSTVCLYSRSVYGYSDLGANRRRVEDWLARVRPAGG
jgi:uncharacterized protein (DUF1499 family)